MTFASLVLGAFPCSGASVSFAGLSFGAPFGLDFTYSVASATMASRNGWSLQKRLLSVIASAFRRRATVIPKTQIQAWALRLYQPETRSIESLNQPSIRLRFSSIVA